MNPPPGTTAAAPPSNAHRAGRLVEIALLVLTAAGIGALMIVWTQLDVLLAPGESPDLVRARLLRGIMSLAIPFVALLSVAALRGRAGALMAHRLGGAATFRNARLVWLIVVMMIIVVLALDAIVVIQGFRDIDFDRSPISILVGA